MGIGYYVICGLMILFGLFGLFGLIFRIQKQAQKELLDELLKNNDINDKVYVKYLNK